MPHRLLFLNRAAARDTLAGRSLNPGYVAACRWFHCGLIDRTYTLTTGIPYYVLDHVPVLEPGGTARDFDSIADSTGENIVRESLRSRRLIQVLWSGGIDSTAAVVSLSKAAYNTALRSRIQIVCSTHSLEEYPAFFANHIAGTFSSLINTLPIGEALDDSKLIVTGEHGDQLFGSVKLEPLVNAGDASLPYRTAIHGILTEQCRSEVRALAIARYLEPQIHAAPVPIETVFDYFWWVNFSLKWQHVSLRLPVFRYRRFWATYSALRHFFRGARFQRWALESKPLRRIKDWHEYKEPAKRYIYAFTKDGNYYQQKTKEPSLQNVLVDRSSRRTRRYRVHWFLGQKPRYLGYRPKRLKPAERQQQ